VDLAASLQAATKGTGHLRELRTAAAADGDTDENTDAVHRAWQARIQQIHDLLINAVVGEGSLMSGAKENRTPVLSSKNGL
jgi:hypothetical protein